MKIATIRTLLLLWVCATLAPGVGAQVKIMPLGDSNTHGVEEHASYRYELWFDLELAGYDVDFVGRQTNVRGDLTPNPAWYPDYFTTFDRDHEGYTGLRSDEVANLVIAAATAGQPDVVLVHLGTNDVGQLGAIGVTNADVHLRLVIDRLRSVRPAVVILLAQVIPMGPASKFGANEAFVAPLNAAIATVAADKSTPQSPVVLVDQHTGFDPQTMLQGDDLHANILGETRMSAVWLESLASVFPPPTGVTGCFGIGCPCGNDDGAAGCANSTGSGGLLLALGSNTLAFDDLVLTATQIPPNNNGLFYMGDTVVSNAFFDGVQCASGSTFRFLGSIQNSGPSGTMTLGPSIAASTQGLITSGSTWHFQAWHRDYPGTPCVTGANLTSMYSVTFVP